MSKYLKLLAVVEKDYEPITGEVTVKDGIWDCENVISIKLDDEFAPVTGEGVLDDDFSEFIEAVLNLARKRDE